VAIQFALFHSGRWQYRRLHGLKDVSLETKDCFGQTVRAGDRVKVIGFSDAFMNSLLPEDHRHISQMIGEVFVVEEIDDGGQAWVMKWWSLGGGETDAHGIGLASSEMEFIEASGV
jgi:hypothetical protein